MAEEQWCSIPSEDAFTVFNSHPEGLSQEEAEIRLARDGYNEVSSKQEHGPVYRFSKQFASPLMGKARYAS